ncbi:MAG: hypothetical protein DLM63_00210 [Solirubrobacterales bacterium]|nr:MAG: hypothetical protein DLM63_00210 [Solirubrobacterales bacterium]
MRSPEKVLVFLEQLQSYRDEEIEEALGLPIPAPLLRMALTAVVPQVPENADDLDELLDRLGEFALSLRSDVIVVTDEPAAAA